MIHEDTGLPDDAVPAARRVPGGNGPGQRAVLAVRGVRHQALVTQGDAAALVAGLAWRGIRGYPLTDEPLNVTAQEKDPWRSRSACSTPPASSCWRPTRASTDIEKQVADAVKNSGTLAIDDVRGRKILVPGDKIAYVEIGGGVAGQVGFRS